MADMSPSLIRKDPDAIVTKIIDWTAYLARFGGGVTLSSSSFLVDPASTLTVSADSILPGNLMTTFTLSSGANMSDYQVTNRVTLSTGNIEDRSVTVVVQER